MTRGAIHHILLIFTFQCTNLISTLEMKFIPLSFLKAQNRNKLIFRKNKKKNHILMQKRLKCTDTCFTFSLKDILEKGKEYYKKLTATTHPLMLFRTTQPHPILLRILLIELKMYSMECIIVFFSETFKIFWTSCTLKT